MPHLLPVTGPKNRDINPCVLDRATREWSLDDMGAWLVTEQAPYLLDLIETGGEALCESGDAS